LPPSAASDGRTSGPPSSAKAKDKSLFHHQVAAEAIKELETNTNPPECRGTFSIKDKDEQYCCCRCEGDHLAAEFTIS